MDLTQELTPSEQLEQILHGLCGGNQSEFARRCGQKKGSSLVGGWIKRGSFDVRRVATSFPEISIDWLVYGKGPMLKADCRKYGIPTQSLDDIDPAAPASDTAVLGGVSSSEQPSSGAPTYPDTHDTTYHIQENEPVDRAFVNVLLQQVSTLTQQVAMLQAQNLQLNIDKATLEERMRGAANGLHDAVAKHPDLKPNNNK